MSDPTEQLIDETTLRRALRLDPGEVGPRLDLATLVARAEERPDRNVASLASGALSALAAAVLVAYGIGSLMALGPALVTDALSGAISVLTELVIALAPAFDAVQQPTVPIALVAALGLAITYEYRTRREHAHVYRTS